MRACPAIPCRTGWPPRRRRGRATGQYPLATTATGALQSTLRSRIATAGRAQRRFLTAAFSSSGRRSQQGETPSCCRYRATGSTLIEPGRCARAQTNPAGLASGDLLGSSTPRPCGEQTRPSPRSCSLTRSTKRTSPSRGCRCLLFRLRGRRRSRWIQGRLWRSDGGCALATRRSAPPTPRWFVRRSGPCRPRAHLGRTTRGRGRS